MTGDEVLAVVTRFLDTVDLIDDGEMPAEEIGHELFEIRQASADAVDEDLDLLLTIGPAVAALLAAIAAA